MLGENSLCPPPGFLITHHLLALWDILQVKNATKSCSMEFSFAVLQTSPVFFQDTLFLPLHPSFSFPGFHFTSFLCMDGAVLTTYGLVLPLGRMRQLPGTAHVGTENGNRVLQTMVWLVPSKASYPVAFRCTERCCPIANVEGSAVSPLSSCMLNTINTLRMTTIITYSRDGETVCLQMLFGPHSHYHWLLVMLAEVHGSWSLTTSRPRVLHRWYIRQNLYWGKLKGFPFLIN